MQNCALHGVDVQACTSSTYLQCKLRPSLWAQQLLQAIVMEINLTEIIANLDSQLFLQGCFEF